MKNTSTTTASSVLLTVTMCPPLSSTVRYNMKNRCCISWARSNVLTARCNSTTRRERQALHRHCAVTAVAMLPSKCKPLHACKSILSALHAFAPILPVVHSCTSILFVLHTCKSILSALHAYKSIRSALHACKSILCLLCMQAIHFATVLGMERSRGQSRSPSRCRMRWYVTLTYRWCATLVCNVAWQVKWVSRAEALALPFRHRNIQRAVLDALDRAHGHIINKLPLVYWYVVQSV